MKVTAIVPVKPWALSKSRLRLDHGTRIELARAFALDVLDGLGEASSVDEIVIVSAEPELGAIARRRGAVLLTDRPMLSSDELNVAIDRGRRWAMSRRPKVPVMVVPADLAALTGVTVDEAVDALLPYEKAFVPDMTDSGTTVSWAWYPVVMQPLYGPGSAASHALAGAHRVRHVDVRVRHDVDTNVDLREVCRLGIGANSRAALDHLGFSIHRHVRL